RDGLVLLLAGPGEGVADIRERSPQGPERRPRRRGSLALPSDLDRQGAVTHPDERVPDGLPEGRRGSPLDACDLTADEDDGPDLPGYDLELGDELVQLPLERLQEGLQVTAELHDAKSLVELLDALPELPEVPDVADRERRRPEGGRQDQHLVLRLG